MISFKSKDSQESSPTPQFESINSSAPTTRVKKQTQEMKGLSPPVPRTVGDLGQRETGPGISGRLTTLGLVFFFLICLFFIFGCGGSSLLLGLFSSRGARLLTAVASLVGEHGLQSLRTSVIAASRAQA